MNLIEDVFYYFVNMPIGRGSLLERVTNIPLEEVTTEVVPFTGICNVSIGDTSGICLPSPKNKTLGKATSNNASYKSDGLETANFDSIDLKSNSLTTANLQSATNKSFTVDSVISESASPKGATSKSVTSKSSTLKSATLQSVTLEKAALESATSKGAIPKSAEISKSATSKSVITKCAALESVTPKSVNLESTSLQSSNMEGITCDSTMFDMFRYVKPRPRKSIRNMSSTLESGRISPLSGRKYWLKPKDDNNYNDAFNTNDFPPLHASCDGKFTNNNSNLIKHNK